jgi:hypothetical protein
VHAIGTPKSDEAIHEARRHVKKVRALIRLVQPSLGDFYRPSNTRLRVVHRLLAPVADAEAVVGTLARLDRRFRRELPRRSIRSIREGLKERWSRVDRQAKADHVLQTCIRLLRTEQEEVRQWRLGDSGFRAVAPGLKRSVRRARRSMAVARAHPTPEHYHTWRQRVKDHWFQVRLLEGRCDDRLLGYERRLEALDGYLGEYHNCVLLETILVTEAVLPPGDAARVLQLLRRYQRNLRQNAQSRGAHIYRETPRQFVKRVKRAWRSTSQRHKNRRGRPPVRAEAGRHAQIAKPATGGRTSWAHAA